MDFPQSVDQVKPRIERWLKEEGFEYLQVTGEEARNAFFGYFVTLRTGTKLHIFQPSNKKDSICISTGLAFSKAQSMLFSQKTEIERKEILSEMQFKLASVDVEFGFEDGELPKAVRFKHFIYYDALTKDRFIKAIGTVFKAFMIAGWAFTQSL